jgi:hypothetical protein
MESKVTIGVEYNKRGMIRDGLVDDISTKEMGIPLPRKGSGKNGNVIKRDVAKALVMGVFPDLSEEEVDKMVNNICGDISERQSPIPEATPKETLKLISAMDPQEKESFKELIRESMDKLAAEEKKIEKRMKFEARLEAKNAERSAIPEPLKPPKEKQGDSGSRAAQHARLRAPPEFTKFLPDVPNLYLHWEPRHSRAYAEFKNLKEYQRTKSKKIQADWSSKKKAAALAEIFEYIHQAYHIKFTGLPNYNADWKPRLGFGFYSWICRIPHDRNQPYDIRSIFVCLITIICYLPINGFSNTIHQKLQKKQCLSPV